MEQHEVSANAPDEADERPLWVPPLPPEPEPWSVRMVLNRFGFLLAMLGVLLVFGLIYLNADWLLREPDAHQVTEAPSSTAATPTVSAASESAVLTVLSDPQGARVLVDGDFVGETPLVGHSLEKGTRTVSVQKETYSSKDTVLTVEAERAFLQVTLEENAPDEGDDAIDAEDLLAEADSEPDPVEPPIQETQPSASTPSERTADPPTSATADDDVEVAEETAETVPEPEPEPTPPATGSLQITSQPSGATVLVDGQNVGVTPLRLNEVEAGTQSIAIQLAGFKTYETTATVESGERTDINGHLEEAMAALRILAKPWGNIYIDGELSKKESTVWYTARLEPGRHRIRVEHPALGKWEQTVTVSATGNEDIIVDFNSGGQ
ncbi:MAG TPA: PEGA domain-containing protein [Rhodothermales bacterium]|nr:PEGA domain-containing protein [Rhodothermales bacterium]